MLNISRESEINIINILIDNDIISGLDLGVNQIDTADTYSSGNSEKIIGKIINRNKLKNKIKIYTKVGSVNYNFLNLNSKKCS